MSTKDEPSAAPEDVFVQTLLQQLRASPDELIDCTIGIAPIEIQERIVSTLHKGKLIDINVVAYEGARHKLMPNECHNIVCTDYIPVDDNYNHNVCGQRDDSHNCLYRMEDPPPNTLDYATPMPSHLEAIHILNRFGLVSPDNHGHWNGTDFVMRNQTNKLWWAFVGLLIETGKIPNNTFKFDDGVIGKDYGENSKDALAYMLYHMRGRN